MRNKKALAMIIIMVILLIISFIVILALFYRFSWNPIIDKETCHQSVIYRSTAKIGPFFDTSKIIPLKCQTEKICFSMSGEDCKEISSSKDNKVQKVKLNKDVVKAKEEIKDVIAESMKDCHWMLGQGQLNFMPHEKYERKYGLICSRFVFDDEAKEKIAFIGMGELYSHLEKKKINEISYLEYIYPGWKDAEDAVKLFQFYQTNSEALEKNPTLKDVSFKNFGIDLRKERGYAIIAGIAPEGSWASWAKSIGVAVSIPVGIGIIASGIGAPVGAILIGGAGTIGTTSIIAGSYTLAYTYPDEYDYFPPAIYHFDAEQLKELEIYDFEIAPEN